MLPPKAEIPTHHTIPLSFHLQQVNMTDADDVIPSAKPLVPYLRPRQDALRLRQALTLYLHSHTVSEDNDAAAVSHLALTLPNANANANAPVAVKRIPAEVTGVRREYLQALQENAAAKREYNDLVDRLTPAARSADASINPENTSSELNDYLALLRERRRYEKLQLFDVHLRELAADNTPEDQQPTSSAHALDGILTGNKYGPTDGENVQALVSKLERAVLKAKAKLAKEQSLLRQLKDRQKSHAADSRNKMMALGRTRDTLVQWVEEKLAITTTADDTNHEQRYTDTNTAETAQLIAERKMQIREQYAAYVDARRALLDAVSLLSQPTSALPDSQPKKPRPSSNESSLQDWSSIDVFRTVSEQILPAAKYQKSLALQRSYLAGMLTKEKTNIKHAFDRLSQESHLLPEYPILARQAKFKHITPSTTSGIVGRRQLNHDAVIEHAQAWAFAADAARSSEDDYVEQRIEHGAEMADTASETLQQVYHLLHQERTSHHEAGDVRKEDDNDIWTAEVQRKARAKRSQARGPWAALG
jgi:hypothetical protein